MPVRFEIQNTEQFLTHYENQHGIPQSAGPRGADPDIQYFYYVQTLKKWSKNIIPRAVSSVIYVRLICHLSKTSGFVVPLTSQSARSDVCHICEKHSSALKEAVGNAEKLQSTMTFKEHLQDAAREKLAYQQAVKESLEELKDVYRGCGPIPSTSTQYTKIHYIFEFSQQMFIPHHARQIGPIYFLVPRKVQLFGVQVDGVPKQYNYLVDVIGKHIETNI